MQLSKEEEERIKIANLVVWLQMCVFAADETMNITWFNRHKTKYALNNFSDTVVKEHGKLLKAFWDIPDQIDMPDVCNRLTEFAELLTHMDYAEMQEAVELIKNYLKEKRNGNTN
jgi:hypothetical protein